MNEVEDLKRFIGEKNEMLAQYRETIDALEKENAKHMAAISLFLEGEEAAKQKVRELKKILELLPIEDFIKEDYVPDAADFVDHCEDFLSAMRAASEVLKEEDK